MKKVTLVISCIVLLALSLPVFAQEFPDVPADHWAYQAINELVADGIIQGYPDSTFGGKRAMTRYEFAEALAKAIPAIKAAVLASIPAAGTVTTLIPEPPITTPVTPVVVTPEQLAAMQKMIDTFRDELASLGVDVEGLRRDVAALGARVTALEKEGDRLHITGTANAIGYGAVNNNGIGFDRDSRSLGTKQDILANSAVFNDFDLGIKGKASEGSFVNVLINAGDYTNFALNSGVTTNSEGFNLWAANLDTTVGMGPLGKAHVILGRLPFQLTPMTMKLVDPDTYTNVSRLDNGDFVMDGATAAFTLGPVTLNTFAGKTNGIITGGSLLTPVAGLPISQFGGARALIGIGSDGNLGATYSQMGYAIGSTQLLSADVNKSFGPIGVSGDFSRTRPNDAAIAAGLVFGDNDAWNAKLNYATGKLALAGGYTDIDKNYIAPGYWSDFGRAVNLVNVKGPTAMVSYGLSSNLSLNADAAFLDPKDDGLAVTGRTNTNSASVVNAGTGLDKMTAWKAGLKYGLSSANSVDLGYEEVQWDPTAAAATTTKEKYISIGLGHTFNANAGFKLLYQIVEYTAGVGAGNINPYGDGANYRGGRAAAQVNLKF